MTITNYWLAAPSAAPTVSTTTTGTIQLAHRRINPDGTRTAPSPIRNNIVLPNTATPQTYSNSDVFKDEFLVSNDGGNTWRIVPRTAPLTGAQSIPAFDPTWATTTLTDTQESAATAVDFGTFLSGDSATKTIWIINRLQNISSLSFSVLDQLNNPTNALNGLLRISIVGVGQDSGTGTLNTSFNATKIYSRTVLGSGFFILTANNPTAIKIDLQLVNYPLTGLSENIDYQLSIVPNAVNPAPITLNPVRVGRIIDSVSDEGLADGYVQDSDGLYVYLTTNTPNTIGSPSSGSSIAESWTDKLFALIWEKYNTSILDSSGNPTTKGSSAQADFSANKRLTLPDLRDKTLAGRSTANPLGSSAGSNAVTLSVANLPSHSHSLTTNGAHTHTAQSAGSHTHTAQSAGAHTHTTDSQGAHVHTTGSGFANALFAQADPANSGSFKVSNTAGSVHRLIGINTNSAGSHTHTAQSAGAHTHTTDSQGAHTHTTDSQGSHTHTVGNTGGGDEIDIRQPTSYTHKLISTGY